MRVLLLHSALLLLLFTSTTTNASAVTNDDARQLNVPLFNLAPFTVKFTSTHHELTATGESSPFDPIKRELIHITSDYLHAFFDTLLPSTPIRGYHSVNGVELELDRFIPNFEHEELFAFETSVFGIVQLALPHNDGVAHSSREMVEHVMNQLLRDAFGAGHQLESYKSHLKQSSDYVLNAIVDIHVVTDASAFPKPSPEEEGPPTEEQVPKPTTTGYEEEEEEEEPTPEQPNQEQPQAPQEQQDNTSSSKWGMKQILLATLMGGFLIAALVCLSMYIQRIRRDKKHLDPNHIYAQDDIRSLILSNENNNSSTTYNLTGRSSLSQKIQSYSDPNQNGTNGDSELVPVPAPDLGSPLAKPAMGRRYMNPASPFEQLYGAAFMHQDSSSDGGGGRRERRPSKNLGGIVPMLSISEEEVSCPSSHTSSQMTPKGWFSAWTSSPAKNASTNPNSSSPTSVTQQGFVYRDFPRHDGTPCLMYSPNNEEEEEGIEVGNNDHDNFLQEVYIHDYSNHSTGSLLSDTSAMKQSQHLADSEADGFVSQLEHLMVMRHKEYQERIRMEQERQAYVVKRHELKNQFHLVTTTSSSSSEESTTASPSTSSSKKRMMCGSPAEHTVPTMDSSTAVPPPTRKVYGNF